MYRLLVTSLALISSIGFTQESLLSSISETVYVESSTDTDSDGKPDRIYVSISRPSTTKKLSTLFKMSPYSLGGNSTQSHNVDLDSLPQDEQIDTELFTKSLKIADFKRRFTKTHFKKSHRSISLKTMARAGYARISAHSLGTGYSTGCPTVGDMSEALAGKAVIDWLNGRARAFYEDGQEAKADWANGKVGMTGVSYNGTLPTMIAATGVEGLKAIVPMAAISNWYDYYRANGLVVGPGGYIGEDADELGYFIVRKGTCKRELRELARSMERETGDFSKFWQDRDYIKLAKNIKAATFIVHGQSDWNVKQRHAIELWKALEGVAPRRMLLHTGGHTGSRSKKISAWFDYYLEGIESELLDTPPVDVQLKSGDWMAQNEWPSEKTKVERLFFTQEGSLNKSTAQKSKMTITDTGRSKKLSDLAKKPLNKNEGRVIFLSNALKEDTLVSGTPRVSLNLSVLNRRAANITVAIYEYKRMGRARLITRGWADPQNYMDITQGELLTPGQNYQLSFDLEPKQYQVSKGSKIGVVLTSTDYEYTIRPKEGTKIQFNLGANSFIDLSLSHSL